jgi:hypothetical protein
MIDQFTLAAPCFAVAGGPFAGRSGSIHGPAPASSGQRYALATLYCVLMSDYCLHALGVNADGAAIVIEGSFTGNPWFTRLLAALRPRQKISSTDDSAAPPAAHGCCITGAMHRPTTNRPPRRSICRGGTTINNAG